MNDKEDKRQNQRSPSIDDFAFSGIEHAKNENFYCCQQQGEYRTKNIDFHRSRIIFNIFLCIENDI